MNTPTNFAEQDFRKSSRSEPGKNCVEVARRDGVAQFRDSKTAFGSPEDGRLTLDSGQLDAFLRSVSA